LFLDIFLFLLDLEGVITYPTTLFLRIRSNFSNLI